MKQVKSASYRFDAEIFDKFKKMCKKEGYKQVKLLEKMMLEKIREIEKGNKGNE